MSKKTVESYVYLALAHLKEQGLRLKDLQDINCRIHVTDRSVIYEDYYSPDEESNPPLYLWLCCQAVIKKKLTPSMALVLGIEIARLTYHIEYPSHIQKTNSKKRKKSAMKGHAARIKVKEDIRKEWATGNYASRNACAEALFKKNCIEYETARKYLIGTADVT